MNKTTEEPKKLIDCLIIGAGPAGMTAALYMHRFRRTLHIVNSGESRASLIPQTHNYPGFAKGISGKALLKRLKSHLDLYHISINKEYICEIATTPQGYFLSNKKILSKTIILTTGIKDVQAGFPQTQELTKRGLLRLCPVCDAYEVINTRIAIIGTGNKALKEALFLRRYSPYISILTQGFSNPFNEDELRQIKQENIELILDELLEIKKEKNLTCYFKSEKKQEFETLYTALGCNENNELALQLGVVLKQDKILVDEYQQTSVKGIYAAGDIVSGLNQISVAQSQGVIAASAINILL